MSEQKKHEKQNLKPNVVLKKVKDFITDSSNWGTLIGFHEKEAIKHLYNDDFLNRPNEKVSPLFFQIWEWLIDNEIITKVEDGKEYPSPYYQYSSETKTWVALLKKDLSL